MLSRESDFFVFFVFLCFISNFRLKPIISASWKASAQAWMWKANIGRGGGRYGLGAAAR